MNPLPSWIRRCPTLHNCFWRGPMGMPGALDALTPRVYRELRRMAAGFMKAEREGQTLQATALVHEVYLRLIDVQNVPRHGKAHFFAMCAQMMRRILVDAARKRATGKHGGGLGRIELSEVPDLSVRKDRDLLALNDALNQLEESDPRKAKIVGTPLLRRIDRGRDCRDAGRFRGNRHQGLASGARVATRRNR